MKKKLLEFDYPTHRHTHIFLSLNNAEYEHLI